MPVTPDLGAPQRGQIYLAGRDLLALPPHQRARVGIGYVPQGQEIIGGDQPLFKRVKQEK